MKSERSTGLVVCVIGLWHLGIVNAIGFAEKGYRVIGIEVDQDKAHQLNLGKPPLFEPGVELAMAKHIGTGSLRFTPEIREVGDADFVVIAHDSPVNDQDEVDIGPVMQSANAVAPLLAPDTPLVITSQIPLGTSRQIQQAVFRANPAWNTGVVYTPENLRLGNALSRFLEPDMLVLGTSRPEAREAALALYEPFETEKILLGLESAEMVKHALNTFLALSITFINQIAELADRLGADAVAVGEVLRLDNRIGKGIPMTPGLGFSGGTLARDVTLLRKFAADLGCNPMLFDTVLRVNEGTFDEVLLKLRDRLGSLAGKKIGILGLTYKAGTSTMRRSPAVTLITKLADASAICVGYDPMASTAETDECGQLFTRAKTAEEVATDADALVLVTEWPEFRGLPFSQLAELMKTAYIVDAKNYLDPQALADAGFDYQGFGRGVELPTVGANS